MNLTLLMLWFAACADQDARCKRVSNLLTLGGGLFALSYLLINGTGWLGATMPDTAGALLLTLLLTLPGYALRRLGAGDVKLLMALALASNLVYVLGTLIGAGLAIVLWLVMRQIVWSHTSQWLKRRYSYLAPNASTKPPFVPFLLTGFLLAVLFIH